MPIPFALESFRGIVLLFEVEEFAEPRIGHSHFIFTGKPVVRQIEARDEPDHNPGDEKKRRGAKDAIEQKAGQPAYQEAERYVPSDCANQRDAAFPAAFSFPIGKIILRSPIDPAPSFPGS